jgi:hypothetical protein
MSAIRSSTRLATGKPTKPYNSQANGRSVKASKVTSNATNSRPNNPVSTRAATTVPLRTERKKKGVPEKCTEQQKAELEALYRLTDGHPTAEQMKQAAVDLGK